MLEIAHVMLQAYTVAKETINIMDQNVPNYYSEFLLMIKY